MVNIILVNKKIVSLKAITKYFSNNDYNVKIEKLKLGVITRDVSSKWQEAIDPFDFYFCFTAYEILFLKK